MKTLLGMTLHYDDGTTQKVRVGALVDATGVTKYTYINDDECPIHGPWMAMPAGTTRDGKPYKAFWTCDVEKGAPRCTNRPAQEWV